MIRNEELERAGEMIDSARSISSNAFELAVLDAQMQQALGDVKVALESYRAIVQKYPQADSAKIRYAHLLSRAGQLDECRTLVESLERSPDPQIASQAQKMLAQLFMSRDMLPEAEQYSDKVLRADPFNIEVMLLKAQLEAKRNKLPEALKLVDRALAIQPNHLGALQLKAAGLSMGAEPKGAIAVYRQRAELQPENAQALALIGQLHFQQGEFTACVESCTEALKRKPDAQLAANRRVLAFVELGDPDKAFASIAPIYAQAPNLPYLADAYGWALIQQGKVEEALPILEQAGKQLRGLLMSYHLGAAYVKAGDVEKARTSLKAALKFPGSFPGADRASALLDGL
ncbi:MAG: tetratricopeptide (TPR) repeat protein [Kiritimatiellia bacterium]